MQPVIGRKLCQRVATSMADTRVVLISGPRQAGKTTLARQFEAADRPFLTLDDSGTLAAAQFDPVGFVRGLDKAVIDEIQRAPELLLAIKESVDRDPRSGRFLLTGSANLATLPKVADSLAGRMAVLPLLPFAQAELLSGPGAFIDTMFSASPFRLQGQATTGDALMNIVMRGGYPEALRRSNPERHAAWLEDYLALILDRDVRDIANIDQLDRLPRLAHVLAEHAGQLVNHASFGAALGLTGVTAQKYVNILERLFLVRSLPPWSGNHLSRLVKTPKLHFLDSGLLSVLRMADASAFLLDKTRFGPLLESFVVSEVLKISAWSDRRLTFSHFRTKDQDEVDLVVEDRAGRVVGIEVKAATTVRADDFRGLRKLQEAVGDRFVRGILLHDHNQITPFSERLLAAPVSTLWQI